MEFTSQDKTKTLAIHLYRCQWQDTVYGPRKEMIFALDATHAQDIVYDRFVFNNNVQQLEVTEIPMKKVTRVPRKGSVLVKESATKDGQVVKSEYLCEITRFYCSGCDNQVMRAGDFCDKCGGYFEKGEY